MGSKDFKFTGFKKLNKDIQRKLDLITVNKGLLKGISTVSTRETKKTIRSGVSPMTETAFRPLERSTKANRRSFSKNKKGRKSSFFSVNKSNMTMTGKLVRSLRGRVNKNVVTLRFVGTHHNSKKGAVKNNELAVWHKDGKGRLPSRNVFGLTDKLKDDLVKAVKEFIIRHLK